MRPTAAMGAKYSAIFRKSSIFCFPQTASFPFPVYARRDFWIVKYLEALNRGYSNPTHPLDHFFPLALYPLPSKYYSLHSYSLHNRSMFLGISDSHQSSVKILISAITTRLVRARTDQKYGFAGSVEVLIYTVRLFLPLALPPFLGSSNPHPTFSHMALSLRADPLQRDLCLTWLRRCQQQQYSPCLCVSRYSRGHGCLCTAMGHHSTI